MDTYVKPLTNNEKIFGILQSKITIPQLSKYILNLKKEMEEKETLEYHMNRWENIAGNYFKVQGSPNRIISYIVNGNYVIKKDHIPDFYNITGISYQVVNMIQVLINVSRTKETIFIKIYMNKWKNIAGRYFNVRDNYLYGIMAKKIMNEMKGINVNK